MARTIRTGSRGTLRSKLHAVRPATTPAGIPVAIPAQTGEEADAYTWAVNAALESGDTEIAYEIAAGYRP
jgi:hypothetical protein